MNHSLSKKKVLVVAYFFPPLGGGGVQRTVKFVKYLRDFGYEPTVVTVKKGKHSVADTSFDKDIPDGIRVIRTNFIGFFAPKKKNSKDSSKNQSDSSSTQKSLFKKIVVAIFHFVERFFFVPDIQMLWRPFAVKAILAILRKEHFDVVYSTSSPFTNHLIARDVQRITGVPWVADFRDHWTLAPAYKPVTPVHKWIDRYLEESILREARGVVFNTEMNRREVHSAFHFLPDNSEVIYNGFDPSDFGKFRFQKSEHIEARYIGSYYGKRYSAKEIIPALNLVFEKNSRLRVTFIGDIDSYSREIISLSPYYGKNLFLRNYVPHSEITKFTQEAAFLLVTLPNIPRVACWVPQKLYEYIGSGRPTFALAPEDGEVTVILQKVQGGVSVSPQKSPSEIASRLIQFIDALENKNFASNIDWEAAKYFERKNQTKQLAQLLDRVIS